ncbi:MAG: MmcQ/YjbR family DNA-binding protein [Bacteroidales bacterium]|nr:MmcQ/YjbR family DNA-binding protein [Bacteroidales bacterium]
MDVIEVREYCLQKKGATEDMPFDDVTLLIRVMNKMFALIPLDEPFSINLKCNPERAEELRERYSSVQPGYHMNKKYWNTVYLENIEDKLLKEMIDHSYDEVVRKLSKKEKQILNEIEE